MLNKYVLHFDGSCGPTNPGGIAAFGYTVHFNGVQIQEESGVICHEPWTTNNFAEFYALYKGLTALHMYSGDNTGAKFLTVYGDSQFCIKMMQGAWKGTEGKPYYQPMTWCKNWVKELRKNGFVIDFQWIPRGKNTKCDELSKAHYEDQKLTAKKK